MPEGIPEYVYPAKIANMTHRGLTLRDHFAIEVMNGFISSGKSPPPYAENEVGPFFAKMAYELADAMLEARK